MANTCVIIYLCPTCWHKSQYMPKLADRLTYQEWQDSDRKDCLDLVGERVKEILTLHKAIPLSPSQDNGITRILRELREFYRKNGQITDDEWKTYLKTIE